MSQHWHLHPSGKGSFFFDFAPKENGTGNSNFLDRDSSPVEGVSSASIAIDSPGPNLVSQAIVSSSTRVKVTLTAANCTAGEVYKIECTVTTNASPTQVEPVVAYLHVSDET